MHNRGQLLFLALDMPYVALHISYVALQQGRIVPPGGALGKRTHPMATNEKRAGDRLKDSAETVAKNGAEAFKNGFEKAVKGYDQALGFGKENVEAYLKAANV